MIGVQRKKKSVCACARVCVFDERDREREREREREGERMSKQAGEKEEMRAKEGERGYKRGSGRREEEIVVERQGKREKSGSWPSRINARRGPWESLHPSPTPPSNSHPATIPPPSSRVVRSPCTGGATTTEARGKWDGPGGWAQRGRDRPERRGRGADCIVYSTALSAIPTKYNRTSTPQSAADTQADALPWPLTTANALWDLQRF